MSCVRQPHRLRRSLLLASPAEAFFPASEWMPLTGITAVDFLLRLVSRAGEGEVKPGIQIARARADKPDPGHAIAAGAFVDTVDLHHFRERPELTQGAFVRFGFVGRLRKGSHRQSTLEVEMDVAIQACGEVLGTKTVEVQPFATDSDEAVVPITDWSPTVGVERLKAVFVLLDNHTDSFEYRLVVRSAKDRMEPDPWVAAEGWDRPEAGNSERNTGELLVPEAACFLDRSLFQLGLAFRKTAGASRGPRCLVHTLSHCRYA
jgi:hypothetical protein